MVGGRTLAVILGNKRDFTTRSFTTNNLNDSMILVRGNH